MPQLAAWPRAFSAHKGMARLINLVPPKGSRLGIRFFALVIGTVFIGTALSSALILSLERQQLIDGARTSAQRVGVVIHTSLHHAMETNDKAMLTQVLETIASEAGVGNVRILNTEGRVWLSSVSSENGRRFELSDPLCRACHASETEFPGTAVATSQIFGPVLLNVSVIPNQPACYSCHGSSSRPLGILFFETSLADLQSQLLASFWELVLSAAIIFILLVGLLIPTLNHFVIQPIVKLARGARELGAGNLDYQTSIMRGDDELGELAIAFDTMRRQVKAALVDKERRNKELQMLYEIVRAASRLLDPQQILDITINTAVTSLGVQAGAIHLLDHDGDRFSMHACKGMPKCLKMHCSLWRFDRAVVGLKQHDNRVVSFPIPADTDQRMERDTHGRYLVGIPLKAKGRLMGAMTLVTQPNQTLTGESAKTLKLMGEEIGLALANAVHFQNARSQATLEERERLAREMHDSLAQALGFLKLKASMTEDLLTNGKITQAQANLREVKEIADETYFDVREAIFGLRHVTSSGSDFLAALQAYLVDYRQHYGLNVQLVMPVDHRPSFPTDVSIQLVRIIQEALTNVRKHAHANRVTIRIEQENRRWRVTVEDDGLGFNPERVPTAGAQFLGLHIMRERANSIGAELGLDSRISGGTRVSVSIPFTSEHRDARTFAYPLSR